MTNLPEQIPVPPTTCTLTAVQAEHHAALLHLESIVRNPYATVGELIDAVKRLDKWQPFVPNPAAMPIEGECQL